MKSVMQPQIEDDVCYVCLKHGATDIHHVMNGAYKKKSEEDGFLVKVHRVCHRFIHDHPMTAQTYKKRAQQIYEETHTREEWIARYGKSYL